MNLRRWSVALWCLAAAPAAAHAQDSHFSLRGPGTPSRFESVRARATGGAFAPFDGLSWMTDAALLDIRRLTASAHGISSWREVLLDTASATLRATRFSSLLVVVPVAQSAVVGGGFGAYLDQTYRVAVPDSAVILGEMEHYTDYIASDGGVSDIRFAAAWRLAPRISLGAAFHLLSGVTRSTAVRMFEDTENFQNSVEIEFVQNTGAGVSGGAQIDFTRSLRLAAWARTDTELRVSVRDVERARWNLPTIVGGGLRWTPSPRLSMASYVSARSWSDAGGTNTIEAGLGLETAFRTVPIRLGGRYATLPFAPAGVEPREVGVAAGFAMPFSQGRARLEVTAERLTRWGGDLRENIWSVLLGMTLQP